LLDELLIQWRGSFEILCVVVVTKKMTLASENECSVWYKRKSWERQ